MNRLHPDVEVIVGSIDSKLNEVLGRIDYALHNRMAKLSLASVMLVIASLGHSKARRVMTAMSNGLVSINHAEQPMVLLPHSPILT